MTAPIKDKLNFWYYETLPPGTRVATEQDFANVAKCIIDMKPFLIHSWFSNRFECYRVRDGFSLDKWRPWLDAGRMYVFITP